MRILIVGSDSKYAIEKAYTFYLSQYPAVSFIELFAVQSIFLKYYQKSLFNKVIYRAGLSTILFKINQELRRKVSERRPDVVFVFKGMEIFPDTLKWIKEQGIKLVNYNPDNPFIFSGRGSGNANIRPSLPFFNFHYTYNSSVKKRIENDYGVPAMLLPFGFEISDQAFQVAVAEEEVLRTCFLGNPDKQRASFLSELAENGVDIDVYGHGWKKFIDHERIAVYDAVFDTDFWKTLRKYRVQLNLMRPHNPDSHNMRSFEIPGIGGIQLAPDTPDHRTYFSSEEEIFLYADSHSCHEQIKKLMSLSVDEAGGIRQASRSRSLLSGYSYRDRASRVFNDFVDLVRD